MSAARTDAADGVPPAWTRVTRYDRATVAAFEVTPEGYVRTVGRIAKPGILTYQGANGRTIRELVPAATLNDPEFLASLENKPLTVEHPPVMLTPDNIGEYRKGMVLSPVTFVDGYVQAPIQVDDAAAIEAMRSGKVELSPGYEVDIDPTPGVDSEFGPYDAVQVKRYGGNHTALCDKARGGNDIRLLRTDSAVEVDPSTPAATALPPSKQEPALDYKMAPSLRDALKAHGYGDNDIAACKSDDDAHGMLVKAAKKDEIAPEIAAKQAEIERLAADLAKAQSDLAVMVEQHELLADDMAAKVDDLMDDPDMDDDMGAKMDSANGRKSATVATRRKNFAAIRAAGIARNELESLAETVGVSRADSAALGNAALTKKVARAINPKLRDNESSAYYRAALDMARTTRLDSAPSQTFWTDVGAANANPESSSYVRPHLR